MAQPKTNPVGIGNALYMELILRSLRQSEIDRILVEEAAAYGLDFKTYAEVVEWASVGLHSQTDPDLEEFAHEVVRFDRGLQAIRARQEARHN